MKAFKELVVKHAEKIVSTLSIEAMGKRWQEYQEYEAIMSSFVTLCMLNHPLYAGSGRRVENFSKYEWEKVSDFEAFLKKATPTQKKCIEKMFNEDYIWMVQLPKLMIERSDVDSIGKKVFRRLGMRQLRLTPLILSVLSGHPEIIKMTVSLTENAKALSVNNVSSNAIPWDKELAKMGAPISGLTLLVRALVSRTEHRMYGFEPYAEAINTLIDKVEAIGQKESEFVLAKMDVLERKLDSKVYGLIVPGRLKMESLKEKSTLERIVAPKEEIGPPAARRI